MLQDDIYSEISKKFIEQILSSAVIIAEIQKKELEIAINKQKIWEEINTYINKNWHFHVLYLLNREIIFFNRVKTEDERLNQTLKEIETVAKQKTEEIKKSFPISMENSFKNFKIPLDKESRHPQYTLKNGFFKVEIDEYKGVAKLSDSEGILFEIPADIEAIADSLNKEYRRIFERPFDGLKFFRILRRNYSWLIKNEKMSDGDNLPIRKITSRLGKNEKGFRTDEFIIDLSRLVEQGPFEVDGFRIDLLQIRDAYKGILLQSSTNRSYIGFITFKKVE
jgi:hypothetical protein